MPPSVKLQFVSPSPTANQEQARALAQSLRAQHGAISARELAQRCDIEVVTDRWEVAAGRVLYLAECTRQPPRIVLNETALEQFAARESADRVQLDELVIAHELGHLLLPRPSIWASAQSVEAAAHAFAQAWTGLAIPTSCNLVSETDTPRINH